MSKDEFILAVQEVLEFNCPGSLSTCSDTDCRAAVAAIRAMLKCVEVEKCK